MALSSSLGATRPLPPWRMTALLLLLIACCSRPVTAVKASPPPPIAPPPPSPPPSPSPPPPSGTKDLFPLSPTDVALLDPLCKGTVSNDNFHPCPVQGNCAFANQSCPPAAPYSCNSADSAALDGCKQAYGCGKAVIIKFAQGDVNSCNSGVGFLSSKGNTDSSPTSQSSYYCAATSTDGPGCQALCAQYEDGGISSQPSFKCKSWVLVVPNNGDENPQCQYKSGGGAGYINQAGNAPYVVTPYYGGCGWCFLQSKEACGPTCSSFGLVNATDDNGKATDDDGKDGNSKDGNGKDGNGKDGNGKDGNSKNDSGKDDDGKDGNGKDSSGKDGNGKDGNGKNDDGQDDDGQGGNDKQNIYWALHGRQGCSEGKNDPHFSGADGTRFDFNGVPGKSFCLVSDQRLHINMRMHGYSDTRLSPASPGTLGGKGHAARVGVRTWIRELGFVWKTGGAPGAASHTLRLVARRGPVQARGKGFLALAEFDGAVLAPLEVGGTFSDASGLSLSFLGTTKEGPYEVDVYSLGIGALLQLTLKLRVAHPLLQTPQDAEVHFNLLFDALRPSSAVHGVLGQTYRRDRPQRTLKHHLLAALLKHGSGDRAATGAGAEEEEELPGLEGGAGDYLSSSVLSTDCRFSAFGAEDSV